MWRGHVIKGKVSYLAPWKRVVKFANEIAATIVTRFPPEDFLKSLDVVDPREWVDAHDPAFNASMFSGLSMLITKDGSLCRRFCESLKCWKNRLSFLEK